MNPKSGHMLLDCKSADMRSECIKSLLDHAGVHLFGYAIPVCDTVAGTILSRLQRTRRSNLALHQSYEQPFSFCESVYAHLHDQLVTRMLQIRYLPHRTLTGHLIT